MLTLRAAAQLLAKADSFKALHGLAPLLGFKRPAIAIPSDIRSELGLHGIVHRASLLDAPGPLRLIIAELTPPTSHEDLDIRHRSRAAAIALARHAPTRQWCLCTIDTNSNFFCLATVSESAGTPRVSALRIDRSRVLDSDADTFRTLADAASTEPNLRHSRFADILQRDALSLRFYRELERKISALATSLTPTKRPQQHRSSAKHQTITPEQHRELAMLCSSRLLFLGFLEAKGWLNEQRDFLIHHTVRMLESGGNLHEKLLRPLFFGTLNTPRSKRANTARKFGRIPFLNGGLFAPTALERQTAQLRFSDDAIATFVVEVLDRYRFTASESSLTWSEAAVDPEMLGRTFESLMASDERRRSGAFYTPPHLVDTAITEAMQAILPGIPIASITQDVKAGLDLESSLSITHRLSCIRVLDPACGSGAFLVRTLELLDTLLKHAGDQRSPHERRRALLASSIFGVDRDPMAVWLCELRLWLAVAIECHETDISHIPPLPNLDHHIRLGDSLTGGSFQFSPHDTRSLTQLRIRYSRASGSRKLALAATLDREERNRAIAELSTRIGIARNRRRSLQVAMRTTDLFGRRSRPTRSDSARLHSLRLTTRELCHQKQRLELGAALPFRFATMFADVASAKGFDLIVGNPPWVRPHALNTSERNRLRAEFSSMKRATWRNGAQRSGAGTGFAAQPDIAAAFIERSIQLLAPNGILAMLTPAKLWHTLAGGGIRRLIHQDTLIRSIHDWSDAPAQFDAATYPSLIVAQKKPHGPDRTELNAAGTTAIVQTCPPPPDTNITAQPLRVTVIRDQVSQYSIHPQQLSLDGSTDAPWLLLPPQALAAFHALQATGTPLSQSAIGRPLLGVKCGLNAAFLVAATEDHDEFASITSLDPKHTRQAKLERHMLRPALRGEGIRSLMPMRGNSSQLSNCTQPANEIRPATSTNQTSADLRIIWTHTADGSPLKSLPRSASRWLSHWRPQLERRRDAKPRTPWWTLFRTQSANTQLPRVVWADIGRELRSRVLPTGDPTVALNTCYVARTSTEDDAYALHALLQSTIVNAWLHPLAEPARGGFRRYMGWTVGSLPVPANWNDAVKLLSPLGKLMHKYSRQPAHAQKLALLRTELDSATIRAYGLHPTDLEPLLSWYREN